MDTIITVRQLRAYESTSARAYEKRRREMAEFKPFVAPESRMAEFSLRAVILGVIFGVIFGASTVYLALRAGLTV